MVHEQEEDDHDWDEPQFDDDSESDSDLEPTIDCPYCGREMLECLVQCPACGMYLSDEDRGPEKRPLWITWAIILSFAAVASWFLVS